MGITYPPDFFIEPLGDGQTVAVFRAVNQLVARFRAVDVEKVVRQDGTEITINNQAILYSELEEYFFFLANGTSQAPLVPEDNIVNQFGDLPPAGDHTDEIWFVREQTGAWLVGTRRQSGFYRSNGVNWIKSNDPLQYFVDDQLAFKDSADQTKTLQFQLDQITTGTNRTATWPDKDGTIAMVNDIQPVIQRVEGGRAAPNTSNQYLRSDDRVPMNLNGQRLNYDTTLVSFMVSTNGAETWNAEVRKNGVATPVYTESVTASDYGISVPNVDFDADDEIQFYCNGTGINRPKMIGIFQRR